MEELSHYPAVFVTGGLLCVIAQILIDKTKLTPARILVFYVISGDALTGLKIYDPLVKFAGAGATVPLTGFGYALAKGVESAVDERGAVGILTGGLSATAGGICAALVLAWLVSLIFKGKPK